jgi:hypothetical protein
MIPWLAGKFGRKGQPEPLAVSTAYLLDGNVYLEVRARDRAGNDYASRFLPKVSLAAPGEVLGAAILQALAGEKAPVPGVPPGERMTHWRALLESMGFSQRAFERAAHVVMMSGTPTSGVTFQPMVRDKSGFVSAPAEQFVHCAWSEADVARALVAAFAKR